jgi:predicted nicotinamide N-methyase
MNTKCTSGKKPEKALRDISGNRTMFRTSPAVIDRFRDAGVTLACHISDLLDKNSAITKALLPSNSAGTLKVLELGSGCGVVGIAIAQVIGGSQVLLTDLAEAQEIVDRNIRLANLANGSTLAFQELEWENELPVSFQSSYNLILAADCTYNSDSRYVSYSYPSYLRLDR